MKKLILLHNTRGKKKEPFKPLFDDYIGLYTCGPTVYDYQHIGNLRAAVFHDILKRTLMYAGYTVKHITNITDVGHLTADDIDQGEDKMEKQAKKEKKSVWDISKYYTDIYKEDRKTLNVLEPDSWCKATDFIEEQIDLIKKLEEKGFTYIISDGVYFDTSKFPEYGKWAKLDFAGSKAGIRVQMHEKKNKTDFALWKFSPKDEKREMEWESPWGVGFPGWHIECSAMAISQLDGHFDIHCGGIEHISIHHTNEIAQSECAMQQTFFHYWMHNEHLVLEGGIKMSKSLGNVVLLKDIKEKGFNPLSFRYLCLNTHYKKQLSFSDRILTSANESLDSLIHLIDLTLFSLQDKEVSNTQVYSIFDKAKHSFDQAILDDLETPGALSSLFTLLKELRMLDTQPTDELKGEIIAWLFSVDKMILGLNLELSLQEIQNIPKDIKELAKTREQLRKEKNFEASDKLRDEITQKGYVIMDTEFGPMIRKSH